MPKINFGVIGRGQWGSRIAKILQDCSFDIKVLDISRRGPEESKLIYQERITDLLEKHSQNLIAIWVAVPPGDQEVLVRSALGLRKNVVVEKPWMVSREETEALISLSRRCGRQVALHHQYTFLEALTNLHSRIDPMDQDAVFSGQFTTSKPDRLAIPALYNFGSHLLAVKCLLFPGAQIGALRVGYNEVDRRWVSIDWASHQFSLDFTDHREPLIQRYIEAFEQHIASDQEFPMNLRLGLKVNEELKAIENRGRCEKPAFL